MGGQILAHNFMYTTVQLTDKQSRWINDATGERFTVLTLMKVFCFVDTMTDIHLIHVIVGPFDIMTQSIQEPVTENTEGSNKMKKANSGLIVEENKISLESTLSCCSSSSSYKEIR